MSYQAKDGVPTTIIWGEARINGAPLLGRKPISREPRLVLRRKQAIRRIYEKYDSPAAPDWPVDLTRGIPPKEASLGTLHTKTSRQRYREAGSFPRTSYHTLYVASFLFVLGSPSLTIRLSSLFSLAVLIASLFSSPVHGHRRPHTPGPSCKAAPSTRQWPSQEAWARLNVSTGGRLLQPAPPGAVCHPGQPTFDTTACARVNANGSTSGGWSDYAFHAADPISVDWQQWANDSCFPDPSYPCSGQGYPVFVVNATTAKHVKRGVEFARKHHIRLNVKSSGHDYMGRSVAPNSLSIWTHHIQGFEAHKSFSPKGCCGVTINHTAVTVSSGTHMFDLYTKLDAINQTVVGGGGKTVSVGGYLTGGGHGALSPRYGLGADQVLEMEVVTPSGEIVTANECQNKDLFWAMRGGGGSTFGIMTSVTMNTYPTPPLVNLQLVIATTNTTNPSIFPMVAYVLSQYPTLVQAGLSGYSYFFNDFASPFGGNDTVGGIAGTYLLQDTQDPNDVLKLWAPIFDHINKTWPGEFLVIPITSTFPSFLAWYSVNFDTSPAGTDQFVGSRLLDTPALTGNLTRNAEALAKFAKGAGGAGTAYLVSGPGVHNARPRGGGNSVCPAWRTAWIHATTGVEFAPLNATLRAENLKLVTDIVEPLRELAPNTGAYLNEADPAEPDWQHQFWGDNYERLVAIKRAVDPEDVLWCNPCVGNDRWHEVGSQLCRV